MSESSVSFIHGSDPPSSRVTGGEWTNARSPTGNPQWVIGPKATTISRAIRPPVGRGIDYYSREPISSSSNLGFYHNCTRGIVRGHKLYIDTSWWADAWHGTILSHQHPMRTYSRSLTKTAPSQVVSPYCDVDHGKSGSFESLQADNTSSQIIPVRCFSCGKVIGDKWNAYLEVNCSRGT